MSRHQGDGYSVGQRPKVMPVFNRQMAEDWVSRMQNADGTRGPHFSMEKAKEVMKQYNADCDPVEFWVVLNSLYSDYDQALKKNNAPTLELYACLAKLGSMTGTRCRISWRLTTPTWLSAKKFHHLFHHQTDSD